MYYADQDFLRSISRKRLTSFIFKVSGRLLGGVSAMALHNILATATHKAAQKQYGGGTRPPNSLRYRTSPTRKQQQKTRQLHKKERKPEAVPKKNPAQMTRQIMTIYLGTGKATGRPRSNFFWRRRSQSIGRSMSRSTYFTNRSNSKEEESISVKERNFI